jgi:hypothetical protein
VGPSEGRDFEKEGGKRRRRRRRRRKVRVFVEKVRSRQRRWGRRAEREGRRESIGVRDKP